MRAHGIIKKKTYKADGVWSRTINEKKQNKTNTDAGLLMQGEDIQRTQ